MRPLRQACLWPLPEAPFSNTLKRMQVHFTPEQEAQLAQLATNAGTDAERLLKDAALRLLEEQTTTDALQATGIGGIGR